jgi:hypothetical protein
VDGRDKPGHDVGEDGLPARETETRAASALATSPIRTHHSHAHLQFCAADAISTA